MRRGVLAILAAALVIGGCSGGGRAGSDGRGPRLIAVPTAAPTIQAAVDLARPGDLVLVASGTYHETVTVHTDGVTLRGEDRARVVLDGRGALTGGVVVRGDGVTVENLTVRGYTDTGVLITGDGDTRRILEGYRVAHVTAHANGRHGIRVADAHGGTIEEVWSSGHLEAGIHVARCRPCDLVVRRTTATHNAVGFDATNAGGGLTVVGSTWRANRVGIHLASTNDEPLAPQHRATVVGNLVVDNSDPTAPWHGDRFGVGIAVDGGTANVIDRNRVEGHLTAGIVLADRDTHLPDTNLVRGNVLDRNGVDLAVATPPRSPRGNCFSGNVAATSAPPDIEARFACALESQGGGATIATVVGPPRSGRIPEPPALPSMPGVRAIPTEPASAPPTIDVTSITVPAADGGVG